jgi:hypothetical protein
MGNAVYLSWSAFTSALRMPRQPSAPIKVWDRQVCAVRDGIRRRWLARKSWQACEIVPCSMVNLPALLAGEPSHLFHDLVNLSIKLGVRNFEGQSVRPAKAIVARTGNVSESPPAMAKNGCHIHSLSFKFGWFAGDRRLQFGLQFQNIPGNSGNGCMAGVPPNTLVTCCHVNEWLHSFDFVAKWGYKHRPVAKPEQAPFGHHVVMMRQTTHVLRLFVGKCTR